MSHSCIKELQLQAKYVSHLATLRDGRLASVCNNTICIWNQETEEVVEELYGHRDRITCLKVLTNGYIASGDDHGKIWIWNPKNVRSTGTELVGGHSKTVQTFAEFIAIKSDGNSDDGDWLWLISGSNDKFVKTWDMSTLAQLHAVEMPGLVYHLVFLTDVYFAIKCSHMDQLIIWSAASRRADMIRIDCDPEGITRMIKLNDEYLVTCTGKIISFWKVIIGDMPTSLEVDNKTISLVVEDSTVENVNIKYLI